ncbi:MAG TPA: diacylglycerol kinase family protein [Sphingobium sp.]
MPAPTKFSPFVGPAGRVAVLSNARAHRNRRAGALDSDVASRIWQAMPHTKAELDRTLAGFARERVDTILIDGGDGTVRDVLSLAPRHFIHGLPRMVVVPSGKTNALAVDLGIASRWTVRDVLASLGSWTAVRRSPIEIRYDGAQEARLRGFLFGTGAFVRATKLAQSVHRAGAFNGLAVGLSLAGAVGQTLFGGADNVWRRGDAVTIELPDGRAIDREFYLLLGSTLERLPLGLRPFGQVRAGLKLLGIDAPPRRMLLSAAALLAGSERDWLNDAGYKRADTESFRLLLDGDFILDGESFPGGDLVVTQGDPIDFLVPA